MTIKKGISLLDEMPPEKSAEQRQKVYDFVKPIKEGQTFTINLTLGRKLLFKGNPDEQIEETATQITRMLEENANDYGIIAELTDKGQIHYHGWIQPNNYLRGKTVTQDGMRKKVGTIFKQLYIQQKIGFTVFKHCTDVHGWIKYMTKDIIATADVLPSGYPFIFRKGEEQTRKVYEFFIKEKTQNI